MQSSQIGAPKQSEARTKAHNDDNCSNENSATRGIKVRAMNVLAEDENANHLAALSEVRICGPFPDLIPGDPVIRVLALSAIQSLLPPCSSDSAQIFSSRSGRKALVPADSTLVIS